MKYVLIFGGIGLIAYELFTRFKSNAPILTLTDNNAGATEVALNQTPTSSSQGFGPSAEQLDAIYQYLHPTNQNGSSAGSNAGSNSTTPKEGDRNGNLWYHNGKWIDIS